MTRRLIARVCSPAICVALAACYPLPNRTYRLKNLGTRTDASWCDPSRGLPADPALGLDRPLQLGIASIVHERDGTSESFLAERQLHALVHLPERAVAVALVDHPSDADYSVTGTLAGTTRYSRESDWVTAPQVVTMVGYLVGGTILGTGVLIDAASKVDVTTLEEVGGGLTGVGFASNVFMWTRPANHYSWDQTAKLVLRRGSVVIGEFQVHDVFDDIRWGTFDHLRDASEQRLWRKAAEEIETCIAADLTATPGEPAVAEAVP